MLVLNNVVKKFYTSEVETTAVNNVSLNINQGEFVAIVGPSGCGKSTLLGLMGLLDVADSGQIVFDNVDVSNLAVNKLTHYRKEKIGFVFQNFNLIDELTVEQNIELPLLYHNLTKKEKKMAVDKVLEDVQLSERRKHFPSQLSGGQQQRVAVARSLSYRPEVIFADEPTGNLDSKSGTRVMSLLKQLNDHDKTTIVMVTHSIEHQEYANRTIKMKDGKIA